MISLVTFRVIRSQGEMYIGHGRLSVCVSVPRRIFDTTARTRMPLGVMVEGAL